MLHVLTNVIKTLFSWTNHYDQYDNPVLCVDNMLDVESQEVVKLNKLALKSIFECIICCGKQGISFKGHRDDATADTSNNIEHASKYATTYY